MAGSLLGQASAKTPWEHDPEKRKLSMENGLPRYWHKEMALDFFMS